MFLNRIPRDRLPLRPNSSGGCPRGGPSVCPGPPHLLRLRPPGLPRRPRAGTIQNKQVGVERVLAQPRVRHRLLQEVSRRTGAGGRPAVEDQRAQ